MDWRPVCPTCGRFIAAAAVVPVLDVLTYEAEGLDTIRDMAECGRCGRIEVELRPTRWARLSELDPA